MDYQTNEGNITTNTKIGKLERIEKINQLRGGSPQLWFFLDRKIRANLNEYDELTKEMPGKVFGVFANVESGISITDIFKNDLQSLIRSNHPLVRVIFGDNGTGKSTHLQYFKKILETFYQDLNFYFELDLRHIADKTEKGLWLNIFHDIFRALHKRSDITKILQGYDERDLREKFLNAEIAKNIKNFGQDSSEDYFYGDKFQEISNIQTFFNGVIDILMEKKILTVIAIDEVQQIEKWGDPVFEAFLESFISSTFDKYMNSPETARLFFILSFLLKSPASRNDKYSALEKHSPGFVSRMKGNEIIFCSFTESEHEAALKLIAEITNLDSMEQKAFEIETKSKLTYWTTRNNPREFGKYIHEVFEKLGLLKLTLPERRLIYEKEARNYIREKLIENGFSDVKLKPEPIQGYHFDVYGEELWRETTIKKCAFGEIKTTQRQKLKGEVEDFAKKVIYFSQNAKYGHPENYYFFISPYVPTPAIAEIIKQNSIDWIKFQPSDLIFEDEQEIEKPLEKPKVEEKRVLPPSKPKVEEKPKVKEKQVSPPSKPKRRSMVTKPLIPPSEKTPLKDLTIDQLGDKRKKTLEEHGIVTIKDLITLDIKGNIGNITPRLLLEWKKECERLLNP